MSSLSVFPQPQCRLNYSRIPPHIENGNDNNCISFDRIKYGEIRVTNDRTAERFIFSGKQFWIPSDPRYGFAKFAMKIRRSIKFPGIVKIERVAQVPSTKSRNSTGRLFTSFSAVAPVHPAKFVSIYRHGRLSNARPEFRVQSDLRKTNHRPQKTTTLPLTPAAVGGATL